MWHDLLDSSLSEFEVDRGCLLDDPLENGRSHKVLGAGLNFLRQKYHVNSYLMGYQVVRGIMRDMVII